MKDVSGVSFDEDLRLMIFKPRGILDAKAIAALVKSLEQEKIAATRRSTGLRTPRSWTRSTWMSDLSIGLPCIAAGFTRDANRSNPRFTSPVPPRVAMSGFTPL